MMAGALIGYTPWFLATSATNLTFESCCLSALLAFYEFSGSLPERPIDPLFIFRYPIASLPADLFCFWIIREW